MPSKRLSESDKKRLIGHVRKAVEADNVTIANMAANAATTKHPNVVRVRSGWNKGVLIFGWARAGVGFGALTLRVGDDGVLTVDTEGMGEAFCVEVLEQALREAHRDGVE